MYSSYTSKHSDLCMLLGEVLMEYVNDFENRKKMLRRCPLLTELISTLNHSSQ